MSCTKRPFNSPEEARKQLRVWQQRGRRSAFDSARVYACDECVGKYHVGHSEMKTTRSVAHEARNRARLIDELDDLFDQQHQRILRKLSRVDHRVSNRRRHDHGPLIQAEAGTLCPGGDDLDVRHK